MSCAESCHYLWDWYYIWTIRSKILKTAAILLIVAFILDLVALSAGCWLVGPHGYTGLFDGTVRANTDKPVPVPIVCPILGVLSAVILLCDNLLNLLFITRQYYIVMPAVIVFAFIAALMLMTVLVTWSSPDVTSGQRLSWSFIVASVGVAVDITGCGLCVLDFLSRHVTISVVHHRRTPDASENETQTLDPESVFARGCDTDPGGRNEEQEDVEEAENGPLEEIEMRTI